jgi:hypothetical protein
MRSFIGLALVSILSFFLSSCATPYQGKTFSKTLPRTILDRYCDSFETFREDLWDAAGGLPTSSRSISSEIMVAEPNVEGGKLKLRTKTGGFSQGGLLSKFLLKGDFDIQIEFEANFNLGGWIPKIGMDQAIALGVAAQGSEDLLIMGMTCPEGNHTYTWINLSAMEHERWVTHAWQYFYAQKLVFRLVRKGGQVSAVYKTSGKGEWQELATCGFGRDIVSVFFGIQNYRGTRSQISADISFSVQFDDFRINAAEEIIESEM